MRRFATDAPEFFLFQLGDDETVYKIPLAASMTIGDLKDLDASGNDFLAQVNWLSKFIGDTVNDLTVGDVSGILKAWREESYGQGASVGESSASSES